MSTSRSTGRARRRRVRLRAHRARRESTSRTTSGSSDRTRKTRSCARQRTPSTMRSQRSDVRSREGGARARQEGDRAERAGRGTASRRSQRWEVSPKVAAAVQKFERQSARHRQYRDLAQVQQRGDTSANQRHACRGDVAHEQPGVDRRERARRERRFRKGNSRGAGCRCQARGDPRDGGNRFQ
jgi:hypothetical protein